MDLDPNWVRKAEEWLEEKTAGRQLRCPLCRESSWSLGRDIVAMPVVQDGGVQPSRIAPMLLVVCTTCGHSLLFSAYYLGLVRSSAHP
jgi:hypothetical protein